jgi:PAS domain S-box-containing protein
MPLDLARQDTAIEKRLAFETLLADLSFRFVNLDPGDVDEEIGNALQRVCECLDLGISSMWQMPPNEPDNFSMTHVYRRLEEPPLPEDFDPQVFNPWALERVLSGKAVELPDLELAPPEAAKDLEVWRYLGITSVYLYPLTAGGTNVFGAISFHFIEERRSWPGEVTQRLKLVSQIFANALVRKRVDSALRESEERLKLAAEAAEIGMWLLDIEGQRFWATDRARTIFGYEPDLDITMERFMESVSPSCREPVAEAVRRAVEGGSGIDIEYRIVLPDGRERWLHSCGSMQQESATSPRSLLGATVDVTERKRAEEELQRSYAEVQALQRELEAENIYLRKEHRLRHGQGLIVGESPAIMEVLELVEQVAGATTTVLIEGETGTGKELIAQRIHDLSPRKDRPMVRVNCAALPSTLVETELFGREKGAYTGAVSNERGRFEIADGSTILLDEVAELPLELQPKLLRVLEHGTFERVGRPKELKTDVRVIAATNRDLRAEVEAGRFRSDLYFRLAVFPIHVPPLRARRGDVPLLVWSFVHELATAMNKAVETIPLADMEQLERYDWPGNVRELRNVVERALILSSGPKMRIGPPEKAAFAGHDDEAIVPLDEAQRRHIVKALEATGGKVRGERGAAELLGVNPSTLRSRMQSLGLDPRRIRGDISRQR